MIANNFKQGKLTYTVEPDLTPVQVAELVTGEWKDGYIAFANGEKRLRDFNDIDLDTQFFSSRIQQLAQIDKLEGYVTELDVWRSSAEGVYEEIAIERVDNHYYVQRFTLDTTANDDYNCWYRSSTTKAGSSNRPLFSGSLKTIEVVWPQQRLNIFITVGE